MIKGQPRQQNPRPNAHSLDRTCIDCRSARHTARKAQLRYARVMRTRLSTTGFAVKPGAVLQGLGLCWEQAALTERAGVAAPRR